MDKKTFDQWLEHIRTLGMKPGLSRVKSLLRRLDNPQNKLDIIHITGTNGKGSTATMLSNILIQAGYKTGQFSTPSILGFNHMFLVDDTPIKDSKMFEIVEVIQDVIKDMLDDGEEHPTEYEIIAAIMYMYFYAEHVDFAVVEVAMGGENDCTNVMDYSILSIITPISMDHGAFLGHDLKTIAEEKSGVIKHNSVLITHPQEMSVMAVLNRVCDEKMTVLKSFEMTDDLTYDNWVQSFRYKNVYIEERLLGLHQKQNAIGVIEAIYNLNARGYTAVDHDALKKGIYKTVFAGRFEHKGDWILDGAHNNESLIALAGTFELLNLDSLVGVVGVLKDKDIKDGLLALKPYFKLLIVTEPDNFRKLDSETLNHQLVSLGFETIQHTPSIKEAYQTALKIEGQKVAFGSFYMIEKLRQYIKKTRT